MTLSKPPTEFVSLWTAHARKVYAYIFSMVPNAADADDILQDTSVVLLGKFEEVGPIGNFPAWACKVAQFKVLEFYKQRRGSQFEDSGLLEVVGHEAGTQVDKLDHTMELLSRCLALLSVKDRKLIDLRYRGNHSVERIAQRVGRTTSAVYKALARIRESLLDCVRRKLAEGDAP